MSWERDNYVVGTRYYVVGTRSYVVGTRSYVVRSRTFQHLENKNTICGGTVQLRCHKMVATLEQTHRTHGTWNRSRSTIQNRFET